MTLHETTKLVLQKFGADLASEVKLANLLADEDAYKDYPAMKQVFQTLLKTGYGEKIVDKFKKGEKDFDHDVADYTQQLANTHGFKKEFIDYAFECLLYGLGCIEYVNEPLSNSIDPHTTGSNGYSPEKVHERIGILKKRYAELLEKLITLPQDIIHDAPGYYSDKALTKMEAVETRIAALHQAIGEAEDGWCAEQRKKKLLSCKQQKHSAIIKTLASEKKAYSDGLVACIIVPAKFTIKRSGYYDSNKIQNLSYLEDNIKDLYQCAGMTYDDWCDNEKAAQLHRFHVGVIQTISLVALKFFLPLITLLMILGLIVTYISSSEARESFYNHVSKGEEQLSNNEYAQAIQSFNEAKQNYSGSFAKSYYNHIANDKISSGIDSLIGYATRLFGQGELLRAKEALESLPQYAWDNSPLFQKEKEQLTQKIKEAVPGELEKIIRDISANHGQISPSTKKKLNELLLVNPDDYWLNFLKNKKP